MGYCNLPKFNSEIVPEGYSAKYARLVAAKLFSRTYFPGHAWDLKLYNKSTPVSGRSELLESDELKPGSLVGFYNPESMFAKKGKNITHVALVVGFENGKPIFAHQETSTPSHDSLDQLIKKGYDPREVINPY